MRLVSVLLRPHWLFLFVLLSGCATPPAACTFNLAATLPVTRGSHGALIVTIKIKGLDMRMMVDSGSDSSYLTTAALNRLNTTEIVPLHGAYAQGLGGTMQTNTGFVTDVTVGNVDLKSQDFLVTDFGAPLVNGKPVDGLIGYDVLTSFDIGFDLPDHQISLFLPQPCTTGAPWPGDYAPTPLLTGPNDIPTPDISVDIDGKPLTIKFDSGAQTSLLFLPVLTAANITPKAAPDSPAITGAGLGERHFNIQRMQFSSFDIGAESYPNVWLNVETRPPADLESFEAGLIGRDYLGNHRVFIAGSSKTVYLSLSVPPSH
jgi:hypothetical protein